MSNLPPDLPRNEPLKRTIPSKVADPIALAALATGIMLLGVVPLTLGIIGVVRTRRPGVDGRGFAITGIVLGAISTVGWVFVLDFLLHALTYLGTPA
jgi:hypothetical protein